MIGPFVEFEKNPVLKPGNGFYSKAVYNPAVIKEGDTFFMFFRAESFQGKLTGRIGLAESKDGFSFKIHPQPVIVPDSKFDKMGCEDPRIVKIGDTFYLTYVSNAGKYRRGNICLATSRDLIHWEKHGTVLEPKSKWCEGQIDLFCLLQKTGVNFSERVLIMWSLKALLWRSHAGFFTTVRLIRSAVLLYGI